MIIRDGKLVRGPLTVNARGGTELLAQRVIDWMNDPDLLTGVDILVSRLETGQHLRRDARRVGYWHDVATDPGAALLKTRWNDFDEHVFVSSWQRAQYIQHFNPRSEQFPRVIENAIEPFSNPRPRRKINLHSARYGYWSTPHRGLYTAFEIFKNIWSEAPSDEKPSFFVCSSFKLYGWERNDAAYLALYEELRAHPGVEYHEYLPNEDLRNRITTLDALLYPSCWPETSCLVLIEAMSAGLLCIHTDVGALPETCGGVTEMIRWSPRRDALIKNFLNYIRERRIIDYDPSYATALVERRHSRDQFVNKWRETLREMLHRPVAQG